MKIGRIKIGDYRFEKDETYGWTCRNTGLVTEDIQIINEIMPKLKEIEKLLKDGK